MTSPDEFHAVSETVYRELFSAWHVGKLRRQAKCDVLLENIILFNWDALILLIFIMP